MQGVTLLEVKNHIQQMTGQYMNTAADEIEVLCFV